MDVREIVQLAGGPSFVAKYFRMAGCNSVIAWYHRGVPRHREQALADLAKVDRSAVWAASVEVKDGRL